MVFRATRVIKVHPANLDSRGNLDHLGCRAYKELQESQVLKDRKGKEVRLEILGQQGHQGQWANLAYQVLEDCKVILGRKVQKAQWENMEKLGNRARKEQAVNRAEWVSAAQLDRRYTH